MIMGHRKAEIFNFLVERIDQKLDGWSHKTLSKGGKVTLLKTAAQVVPNFWISMFLVPVEIYEKIERKMNVFWWGNGESNKGIKWLS